MLEGVLLWGHVAGEADRLLQRKLEKAITRYNELRATPDKVLTEETIVIGPRKIPFRIAVSSFMLTLAVTFLIGLFVLFEIVEPMSGVGGWVLISATFLFWVPIMNRAWRGGYIALGQDGVHFRHRRTTVFCPWGLFCVIGNSDSQNVDWPVASDRTTPSVCFPINPAALDRVEVRKDDEIIGDGSGLKTSQLRIQDETYAELADLYEVHCSRIARLLLELGRQLGQAAPADA
jgi:hypothetical protein